MADAPAGPPRQSKGILPLVRSLLRRALLALSQRVVGDCPRHGAVVGCEDGVYHLNVDGLTGPFMMVREKVALSGWALDLANGSPLPARVRIGRQLIALNTVARPDLAQAFSRIAALPEHCGFVFEGSISPGIRVLAIEVAVPEGWTTLYRCIVVSFDSRIGPFRRVGSADCAAWRTRDLAHRAQTSAALGSRADTETSIPLVTVVISGADDQAIEAMLASLRMQSELWDAVRVADTAARREGCALAPTFEAATGSGRGAFLLPLEAGDRLDPDALTRLVAEARAEPVADLVYADEERVCAEGSAFPVFKPAWSPDTLQGFDYVGSPALIRRTAVAGVGAKNRHDLLLGMAARTPTVRHLPMILCRKSGQNGSGQPGPVLSRREVIELSEPLVSIIIPTGGGRRRIGTRSIDLAINCVESIRAKSRYANYEVLIVAASDLPSDTREGLSRLGSRHVLDERTDFNFSRKINLGAAAAAGDHLLLLNDDTEVLSPDWLDYLVGQASKPHVGVVGAKLLFPDDTIQHAGIVTLGGVPLHVRQDFPADDLGYQLSTALPRNYSAVTAACMMVRRSVFDALGGFSEDFPVNFNDVDFCFRVRALGLSVVYEPGCTLYHFASSSRDERVPPHEFRHFRERWSRELADDPYYPNAAFAVGPPAFEPFKRG